MSGHTAIFPITGRCANCHRERDDLFWHEGDGNHYCTDVGRCEARYEIQAMRPASPAVTHQQPER